MTSSPFKSGLPVVDRIPQQDCHVILRSHTLQDMQRKVRRLQEGLTVKDMIKVYPIGQRPDKPVPVSAFFTEIEVKINATSEDRLITEANPFWTVHMGKRKTQATIIY